MDRETRAAVLNRLTVFLLWVVALLFLHWMFCDVATRGAERTETDWSREFADQVGGVAEYRLPDGRRVDILTDTVAWEVEHCAKWEESVGQSIGYALATDRTPGVWLLKRGQADDEEYNQCLGVVSYLRAKGIRIEFRVTEVSP